MQGFPRLGQLLDEARNRKEVWAWDGVIPLRDTTLVAAFMKKGKTTLLTGLVSAWLKRGSYCGRGATGVRKVLYLAPEEGDTLLKRFERMGFGVSDEVALTVVPRGHPVWGELITRYRMREWGKVVAELKAEGFDTVVLDGLHTMLQMFEPQAKEDNEGVGRFMTEFVLKMDGMTVVAALHTKKGGGDPRMHVPPEEMIRGASAWMAQPGQIIVLEHLRKEDMKRFHAFGRHEGSTADGMTIKYNERTHDFEALAVDGAGDVSQVVDEKAQAELRTKAILLQKVREAGPGGISMKALREMKVTARWSDLAKFAGDLSEQDLLTLERRARNQVWLVMKETGGLEDD
jgi:hypothetical protein